MNKNNVSSRIMKETISMQLVECLDILHLD